MSEAEGRIDLALGFLRKDPERAARVLEMHAAEVGIQLLEQLDPDESAAVLRGMLPRHTAVFLDHLDEGLAAKILRVIPSVQAASILRLLAPRRRTALLRLLPSRQAVTLNWLLSHSDDSVGAWTDLNAFTLSAEFSAQDALAQIRDAASTPTETLFVLGKQGQLLGTVTTTALFRAAGTDAVGTLRGRPPTPLQAQASLASVANLRSWQLHNALPVVDRNQQFAGVLTRETLERGLRHGTGEESPARLTDTLLEATQAYWTGMSALWEATFGLLTTPLARERAPRGDRT